MQTYGKELILDIHEANSDKFNRVDIYKYLVDLCNLIDMEREDLHWWDYFDDPEGYAAAPTHLKGTSVVQFITTSNIVIHAVDELKQIYINIFSCKDFDIGEAVVYTESYFGGEIVNLNIIERK